MSRGVVLVTGASGLVGRQMVARLADRGFEVHGLSRRGGGPRHHAVDLFDDAGVGALLARLRPSHLLHLAWTTEHGKFWHDPANTDWAAASRRLIDGFIARGGRRVVAAGTCAEYDWTTAEATSGDLDAATAPIRPATPYGAAKAALAAWLLARGDVSAAWGRIFFVFGPGEDPRRLIPSVAGSVLRGEVARIGPGDQIRDFIDARDAADLFAALVDGEAAGPFNIATGEGHEIRTVARRIAQLAGRPDLVAVGALPPRAGDPPRLVGKADDVWALARARPRPLDDSLRHILDRFSPEGAPP